MPRGCTVIQWITDFSHRVSQLQEVSRLVSQGGAKEIKVHFNFHPYICFTVPDILSLNDINYTIFQKYVYFSLNSLKLIRYKIIN